MPAIHPNRIEMIPISRITVLNPRARNKRQHREIVNNIETIGLKRPVTVSRRDSPGGPRYDLVCGEGRLEAFQMLGQTEIPAVVIEASENECLVMSLVEISPAGLRVRLISCEKSALCGLGVTAIRLLPKRSALARPGSI